VSCSCSCQVERTCIGIYLRLFKKTEGKEEGEKHRKNERKRRNEKIRKYRLPSNIEHSAQVRRELGQRGRTCGDLISKVQGISMVCHWGVDWWLLREHSVLGGQCFVVHHGGLLWDKRRAWKGCGGGWRRGEEVDRGRGWVEGWEVGYG
jgi:hypothetical protein